MEDIALSDEQINEMALPHRFLLILRLLDSADLFPLYRMLDGATLTDICNVAEDTHWNHRHELLDQQSELYMMLLMTIRNYVETL